jgi:hypothetical protein
MLHPFTMSRNPESDDTNGQQSKYNFVSGIDTGQIEAMFTGVTSLVVPVMS